MATLTSTRLGIPYPDGTERVMDGDNAMGAIAAKLDDLQQVGIPYRQAAGIVSLVFTASRNAQTAVTYPASRFTQGPVIICTAQSSAGYVPCVISATSAGCTVRCDYMDASTPSVTLPVMWVAVQMLPTGGPGLRTVGTEFTATCATAGCGNEGIPITLEYDEENGPPNRVECGVCGQPITDTTL
jgi:hypothetical protein